MDRPSFVGRIARPWPIPTSAEPAATVAFLFSSTSRTARLALFSCWSRHSNRHNADKAVCIWRTGSRPAALPIHTLEETLPFGAVGLSQTAPVQYQDYDRLKSEVELRMALMAPLSVVGFILATRVNLLIILGVLVVVATFAIQSVKYTRQRYDLLANAAYLDLIKLTAVDGTISSISRLDPQPKTNGQWIAALIAGLERQGLYDESGHAMSEIREMDDADEVDDVIDYLQRL